jgi:hypothetical protein
LKYPFKILTLTLFFISILFFINPVEKKNPQVSNGNDKQKNIHPHLYLTSEKLQDLKNKIKEEPFKSMFLKEKSIADSGLKKGPAKYITNDNGMPGEQLYQRDVGDMIPNLALVYLLTDDEKYLKSAIDYMNTSAEYPTWGLDKINGLDLAAGHQLFGMALGYDWLYLYLNTAERNKIKTCLLERGRYMYSKLYNNDIFWYRTYLQNHQWVNMTGLSAAGFALQNESEEVNDWINLCLKKYKTVMKSLGNDGASHEGVAYWTYGIENMLKYMDLAKSLLGEDLFVDNQWFKNTSYYRIYSMLPLNSMKKNSVFISYADNRRADWYGPDYILRKLASVYNNPNAQWLADILEKRNLCGGHSYFLNLFWFDPNIKPAEVNNLPAFKHFDDMDIVFMRSGWNGDESLFSFKCGPYIGHQGVKMYPDNDPGGGHVHPDAGSFQIFANSDFLIVNPGYTFKQTEYENTAIINGIGQIGEGKEWFDSSSFLIKKKYPEIKSSYSNENYDYTVGDVTEAYKFEAGLKKYLRHIIYFKPSTWVIIDEFETSRPSKFELFFHSDFSFTENSSSSFSVSGKNGALKITSIKPEGINYKIIKQHLKGPDKNDRKDLDTLIISNNGKEKNLFFITILESYPAGKEAVVKTSINNSDNGYILNLTNSNKKIDVLINKDSKDKLQIEIK